MFTNLDIPVTLDGSVLIINKREDRRRAAVQDSWSYSCLGGSYEPV
jgi:hypothetical protein